MGMLRLPRGLKAALESLRAASGLQTGEVRYATDEGAIYLATAANAFRRIIAVGDASIGAAGQVLTSNGPGSDPTFQNLSIGQYTIVTGNTTLTSAMANSTVIINTTSVPATLTIPTNAADPIPVGSRFYIETKPDWFNYPSMPDTQGILIDGASVSLTTPDIPYILPGSGGYLLKIATDTWSFVNHSNFGGVPQLTFVTQSSGTTGGGFSTANKGMKPGDLWLIFVETASQTPTTPSGFTVIPGLPQTNGTAGATTSTALHGFYRVIDGTEGTALIQSVTDHWYGIMFVVKNVDPVNPFNTGSGATATASTAVSMPTITTTRNNCLILNVVAYGVSPSSAQVTGGVNSNLSSLRKLKEQYGQLGNGGGLAVFGSYKSSPGATGATTATLATSSVQAVWSGAINVKL